MYSRIYIYIYISILLGIILPVALTSQRHGKYVHIFFFLKKKIIIIISIIITSPSLYSSKIDSMEFSAARFQLQSSFISHMGHFSLSLLQPQPTIFRTKSSSPREDSYLFQTKWVSNEYLLTHSPFLLTTFTYKYIDLFPCRK